jgi:beta-mannanase
MAPTTLLMQTTPQTSSGRARAASTRSGLTRSGAGNWFPWAPYSSPGSYGSPYISASDWIAGFRNLVDALRANPLTAHIKIAWDYPTLSPGGGALSYYPGDSHVDIISTDYYFNTQYDGPTSSGAWNKALGAQGINDWAAFAAAHGKPMAVWEWCDMYSDGYNVTHFSEWMKTQNLVAHSYWDSNDAISNGTCRLQDDATRQNAYVAEWKNWQYTGNYWGSPLLPIPAAGYPGY